MRRLLSKMPATRSPTPPRKPRTLFKTRRSTRLKICKVPWQQRKRKPKKRRRTRKRALPMWMNAGRKPSIRCKQIWRWRRSRRNCGKPKRRKRRKMQPRRWKSASVTSPRAQRKRRTTPSKPRKTSKLPPRRPARKFKSARRTSSRVTSKRRRKRKRTLKRRLRTCKSARDPRRIASTVCQKPIRGRASPR